MRLLPLNGDKEKIALHAKMWSAFLQEQGRNSNETLDFEPQIFLIESNSNIIGFCDLHLEEECFPDEDLPELCLKICAFYIMPDMRDKSLGRQAFKLVRQWGHDNKAAIVETEVGSSLVFSQNFFKDQGLELVGKGKRYVYRGFV